MPMNSPPALHHHLAMPGSTIIATILTAALLLVLVLGAMILMRKFAHQKSREVEQGWASETPDTDNASAFMTASMQGVIEKLRAQEKELARLHLLAQERAQESERLTEEVTRNMPTGLLLVNATGAISSTNPAAEEALAQRPLRYRGYREVLGADSDLAQMLTACLKDGKTIQRGEVEHLTRDGDVRRLGVTISPIYRSVAGTTGRSSSRFGRPAGLAREGHAGAVESETGAMATGIAAHPSDMKISGALCLMSDLTQLAALQKQIRWKENLAALGEMSAGIAHEFKNALATISGYAQMIRGESQPGDTRDSAERILDQTRALTHIVTEFLRFAKPLEICYETVPMQALAERVAREVQEAIPQCAIACEGTFTDLPGDEALIRQALVNLTRNAAEAARAAGKDARVRISGSLEDLGGRKWQRLCVADNGPGVPEHDLPKIFLPFYTTKSEGTGLGLAVVQKVALQHGGSIEARNVAGVGAEFLLWLPLRQEPSPSLFPSQAAHI
jgi:nitrogen-specific signal transduction histidine kinase